MFVSLITVSECPTEEEVAPVHWSTLAVRNCKRGFAGQVGSGPGGSVTGLEAVCWGLGAWLDVDPLQPVDGTDSGCCLSGDTISHSCPVLLWGHSFIPPRMTGSPLVPDWAPEVSQTQALPSWDFQARGRHI